MIAVRLQGRRGSVQVGFLSSAAIIDLGWEKTVPTIMMAIRRSSYRCCIFEEMLLLSPVAVFDDERGRRAVVAEQDREDEEGGVLAEFSRRRRTLLLITAMAGTEEEGGSGHWRRRDLIVNGGDGLWSRQIWNLGLTADRLDGFDRPLAIRTSSKSSLPAAMVVGLEEDDGAPYLGASKVH
ncbi:hypothetical protein ACLOJK_024079 [Asimina triloba]